MEKIIKKMKERGYSFAEEVGIIKNSFSEPIKIDAYTNTDKCGTEMVL